MIQESEVIVWILATGMLIIMLTNLKRLTTLPQRQWLVAGYSSVYAGWTLTILEGFAFGTAVNIIEHICYALSMVFLAGWSIHLLAQKGAK
jgi:uncharacterized membrane protein